MKTTRCQECGFFTETTRCQHCGSIVVPKQLMTKAEYEAKNQELRDNYVCDSDYFGRLVDVDSDYIESLEARIAELEAENKYLRNMPIMKVEAPEAVIYENALDVNRELKITVNTQQKRIKELEAMTIDEFALMQHRMKHGEEK